MLSYRIDIEFGIVEVIGEESGPEDFERVVTAVLADPNFRLKFGFLRDRRRAPSQMGLGLVRRRVELVRHLRAVAKGRWAIVADAEDLTDYETMRVGAILADDSSEVALFTDVEAARRWLGEHSLPNPGSSVASTTSTT